MSTVERPSLMPSFPLALPKPYHEKRTGWRKQGAGRPHRRRKVDVGTRTETIFAGSESERKQWEWPIPTLPLQKRTIGPPNNATDQTAPCTVRPHGSGGLGLGHKCTRTTKQTTGTLEARNVRAQLAGQTTGNAARHDLRAARGLHARMSNRCSWCRESPHRVPS